jgi:hypothetical protein
MSADKELHAENVLESMDLPADCRLRKTEIVRCKRDAHPAPDRNKASDQIKRWKS